MKADKEKMFSVELSRLRPEEPVPFPLFLFLRLNNRMVPVRLTGDAIGQAAYEELRANGHLSLWVPNSHAELVKAYLESVTAEAIPARDVAELISPNADQAKNAGEESEADKAKPSSEEALGIADKVKSALASPVSERLEATKDIASELLRRLYSLDSSLPDRLLPVAELFRVFADEFLLAEGQDRLFPEVQIARSFQPASAHTVFAGGLAAVLSALEKRNEAEIASVIGAAAFHDLGLAELPAALLAKDDASFSKEEASLYQAHVEKTVSLLERSADPLPASLIRMVKEHHERPDGSGFPGGLLEADIFPGSLSLAVAVDFDRLIRSSAAALSPQAALDDLIAREALGKERSLRLKEVLA